jgi:flagellar protein FlaG
MDIKPINNVPPAGNIAAERAIQNNLPKPQGAIDAAAAGTAAHPERVEQAVKTINASLQSQRQGIEFTIDSESQRTVVKVIDQETKQVLRQMPTQEALEIASALDRMQGLLIKQKA